MDILLIEDSISDAADLRRMLCEIPGREFRLQHAQDLEQGLALLTTRKFDAVLVDLELPGKSGLEAALAVRERSATVPVVALTAHDDDELALAALQMDIQDYLPTTGLSGPRLARAIDVSVWRKRDGDLLRKSREELELHLVQSEEQNLELRRAQVESEVMEERYHNLYHFAPVGYLTIDRQGKIVECNEGAASLLGRGKKWLTDFPLFSFLAHESRTTFHELLRGMNASKMQHRCEIRLKPGAGAEWVLLEGILTSRSAEEREKYLLGVIDITERKRAEEKIVRLNELLSRQATELEQANKELEAFNYTVAHDLRQPLNLIYLSCQGIRPYIADHPECHPFLKSIFRGVERMGNLIETLLRFSLVGKAELKREPVDLANIARLVSVGLQATAPRRTVCFEISEGIPVKGDPELLRVILDNLLGNAWKFTEAREDAVIAFGSAEMGEETVYFVRDNGTGFDITQVGGVFSPFVQLPEAKRYQGFGIGLATVERIIQRHGGRIWAEAEHGKGATFYFTLPEPIQSPSSST